jgi:hypothetical protein
MVAGLQCGIRNLKVHSTLTIVSLKTMRQDGETDGL